MALAFHCLFGVDKATPEIVTSILFVVSRKIIYYSGPATGGSIRYPGILSNYDYRQMTPEVLLAQNAKLIKVRLLIYLLFILTF